MAKDTVNGLPSWMFKKAPSKSRGRPRTHAKAQLPVPPKGVHPPAQRAMPLSKKASAPEPSTAPDFSHLPVKLTHVITKPWYAAIRLSSYGSGHTEYLDPNTLSWTEAGVEQRIKDAGAFNQVCPAVRIVKVTLVMNDDAQQMRSEAKLVKLEMEEFKRQMSSLKRQSEKIKSKPKGGRK